MHEVMSPEDRMAERLLDQYQERAEQEGNPIWLELSSPPAGADDPAVVELREEVLGHRAPDHCVAVAVIGTGRMRMLNPAQEPPASLVPGMSGGLRMACVVSRAGRVGWRMVLPDGSTFDHAPEEGEILDIQRRVLGLPTPLPADPAGYLLIVSWVSQILVGPDGPPLTWDQTLRRHPALMDAPDVVSPDAEYLISELALTEGWEALRLKVASGYIGSCFPSPELADWMDEGMFARWVLAELPDIEGLMTEAGHRLTPTARRRLGHMVHRLSPTSPVFAGTIHTIAADP